MNKTARVALGVALFFAGGAVAFAATPTTRVRGTIVSVKPHAFTVKTYAGQTEHIQLGTKTSFVSVVPSHLDQIKSGDFVGIGATGGTNALKALEVVIFPNSMRGTGEGHYPWSVSGAVAAADRHQTASMPAGAPPVKGTMTNGTVTNEAPNTVGPPVHGTMTNGTVTGSTGASSGKKLTVSYNNGKHVDITVPAGAPVVRFVPASHAILKAGAKTFTIAKNDSNGHLQAKFVAVGKDGVTPPM